MQQLVDLLRLNPRDRGFFVDHSLAHHINGNFHCCLRGALAASGLQHIQFIVLDCELHVLHVFIVLFQKFRDLDKTLIGIRKRLRHLFNALRRANAGNDILSLRVD